MQTTVWNECYLCMRTVMNVICAINSSWRCVFIVHGPLNVWTDYFSFEHRLPFIFVTLISSFLNVIVFDCPYLFVFVLFHDCVVSSMRKSSIQCIIILYLGSFQSVLANVRAVKAHGFGFFSGEILTESSRKRRKNEWRKEGSREATAKLSIMKIIIILHEVFEISRRNSNSCSININRSNG